MNEKRIDFGKYLKAHREKKGLSKRKASLALGYKSDGTINSVEQGFGPLPVEKIHPVAELYGIPLDELLDRIRTHEPQLYAKYTALWDQMVGHFTRKVAGLPRHHLPFAAQEGMSDNVSYSNHRDRVRDLLYIMSTQVAGQDHAGDSFLIQPDPNQLTLFPTSSLYH